MTWVYVIILAGAIGVGMLMVKVFEDLRNRKVEERGENAPVGETGAQEDVDPYSSPSRRKESATEEDPSNESETKECTGGTVSDSTVRNTIKHTGDNLALLETVLKKLGCQPLKDKEEPLFYFHYQGEAFSARIFGNFMRIWDLPYNEVDQNDLRVPSILEAINAVNGNMGPTVLMLEPNENGKREIASRMDLLFDYDILNPDMYLSSILKMFFDIKHNLRIELEKHLSHSSSTAPFPLSSVAPSQN